MGIVRVKEFEEEFEQEEIEIYALLREAPNGAAAYLKDYLRPLVYTDATVDCKTGVLDRREGILTWLISSDREAGWGYDFKQYGIYRLLVRKAKIKILDENRVASWNNRYLVLKVLEWDAGQKELEALAAYLQQPKYIHTQRGDFLLNRQYKWYEMKTPDCGFTLDADEGSDETCEAALAAYKKYEMNMPPNWIGSFAPMLPVICWTQRTTGWAMLMRNQSRQSNLQIGSPCPNWLSVTTDQ